LTKISDRSDFQLHKNVVIKKTNTQKKLDKNSTKEISFEIESNTAKIFENLNFELD